MGLVSKGGFLDRALGSVGLQRKSVAPTQTAGGSGTPIYGGYIVRGEKDSTLSGTQERNVTFSEALLNASIVSAGVRFFLGHLARSGWRFDPPSDAPGADEIAERVSEIIDGMETPLHRIVRRSGMFAFYGFSVQEWTARRQDDGSIGIRDVEQRPQATIEKWDCDESGTVRGVVQRLPQDGRELYIPRAKLLYVVDDSISDSPEGLGMLRQMVPAVRRLARYEQLEGFGYETDLRGVPIGRVPMAKLQEMVDEGKITAAQRTAWERSVQTFVENHIRTPDQGIILDSAPYFDEGGESTAPSNVLQWGLELLNGSGVGHAEIASAIQRLNREIARVMGVEGMLLGESGAGSLAMAREKGAAFTVIVQSAQRAIADAIDSDIIRPIMRLNGWDESLSPSAKHDPIRAEDVDGMASTLRDLALAGLPDGDPATDAIRAALGLPPAPVTDLDAGREDEMIGREPSRSDGADADEVPERPDDEDDAS